MAFWKNGRYTHLVLHMNSACPLTPPPSPHRDQREIIVPPTGTILEYLIDACTITVNNSPPEKFHRAQQFGGSAGTFGKHCELLPRIQQFGSITVGILPEF
jgi:hypothetical protein